MVDATDLKSVDLNSRVGSSPTTPIIRKGFEDFNNLPNGSEHINFDYVMFDGMKGRLKEGHNLLPRPLQDKSISDRPYLASTPASINGWEGQKV